MSNTSIPERDPGYMRAMTETILATLVRDADRISAIREVLAEIERDIDHAARHLEALLAADRRGA